jgi:hypothetical protein
MSEEGKPGDARGTEVIRASSHFLGHGMTFAASVALFGWVGFEVGTRIGAESLLLILGMLLGGAAGFYNLYLQVVVRPREDQGREEGEEN